MRNFSIIIALFLLVPIAGCTEPAGPDPGLTPSTTGTATTTQSTTLHPHAQPVHAFFDFGGETAGPGDLSGWKPQADVPMDPNNPVNPVAWNVTACDAAGWEDHVHIQAHPVHSACFAIDGRQGDGTVWITRSIAIERGASYVANVSVRALGTESFNTVADVVLRLGTQGASKEADFATANEADHVAVRRPLDIAPGWTLYGTTWQTGPLMADHLIIEVGISVLWETEMTRDLDALTVDLQPA